MDLFDKKGIEPMLISEQVDPYDDADSIFELKLDGCRCIAYCGKDSVDLRNKRDRKLLPQFPELEQIYKNCHGKCILDGELIVPVGGRPDFYELQKRTLASNPFKIRLAISRYPAAFVAYDILRLLILNYVITFAFLTPARLFYVLNSYARNIANNCISCYCIPLSSGI